MSLAVMAQRVDIKKSTLSNYENGVSEPSISGLTQLSHFFECSVDDLIKADMSKNAGQEPKRPIPLAQKPDRSHREIKKSSIVAVDTSENSVVPILDVKAAAGPPTILDEPDYYRELPSLTFPNYFFRGGALVSIPVRGDSMTPTIKQGDYVVGKELEQLSDLRSGEVYIVIHQGDHRVLFTVKRCFYFAGDDTITLQSDNSDYPADKLPVDTLLKVYHVEACLTTQMHRQESSVRGHLERIERRIDRIEQKVN